ncbi:hypothetical protein [Lapidilactobacillus salsurivasis]
MKKSIRFLQVMLILIAALAGLILVDLVPFVLGDWLRLVGWLPGAIGLGVFMYLAGILCFIALGLTIIVLQSLIKTSFGAPLVRQRLRWIQGLLWGINGLQLLCLPGWWRYAYVSRTPQVLTFNLAFFLGVFSLGVLAYLLRQLSLQQAASGSNEVTR